MAEFKTGDLKLNAGQGIIFGDDQKLTDIPYTQAETDALIEEAVVSGIGVENHSELNELDYATSGHTGFAPTSHDHVEDDITDLDKYTQAETDSLLSNKAALIHEHYMSDIVDFDYLPTQSGNAGKYLYTDGSTASWATVSGGGEVTNEDLATVSGAIVAQIPTDYAPSSHSHLIADLPEDVVVDSDLSNYAPSSHSHSYTDLPSDLVVDADLNNYSLMDHDHDDSYSQLGHMHGVADIGDWDIATADFITDVEDAPGGAGLFKDITEQTLTLRSLLAGTGISVTGGADIIEIASITAGENMAGGTGIYKDKDGANLRFKSFTNGTGIQITESSDNIEIASTTAGENKPGGEGIYDDKDGANLRFKSLVAGTNISITGASDTITIDATGDVTSEDLTTLSGAIVSQIPTDYYTQDEVDDEFEGIVDYINDKADQTALTTHSGNADIHFTEASIDHGSISGLSDDDHTQYYNETRGDARYSQLGHDHSEEDITDLDKYTQDEVDNLLDDKYNVAGGLITGNVTIGGNLTVSGTQFISHAETVEVADNMMLINAGETGAGITTISGGLEIDRGTEPNYQFIFDETEANFRVGEVGNTEAVATREDDPLDGYLPVWNETTHMWETVDSVALSDIATQADLTTLSGSLQTGIDNALSGSMSGDIDLNHYNISFDSWTTLSGTDRYTSLGGNGFGEYIRVDDTNYSSPGNIVRINPGDMSWISAYASAANQVPAIGIVMDHHAETDRPRVLLRGIFAMSSWSFTSYPGDAVYLSTTGGPTQTPPSGVGEFVQVLGFALDEHTMYFNPSYGTVEVK